MNKMLNPLHLSKLFAATFILLNISNFNAWAGDPETDGSDVRSVWTLGVENAVTVYFKNDEAFTANDFEVSLAIWRQTSISGWELEYSYYESGITFHPNSTVEITTGLYTPTIAGKYQLAVSSYSPDDIDLTNNNYYKDFIVGNYKRLSLKQVSLIEPYQQENSTWGAFKAKLPAKEYFSYLNVKLREPETTNEQWMIKNAPSPPFAIEHTLYYYFNFGKLGYISGVDIENIDMAIREDEEPVLEDYSTYEYINKRVWNLEYQVPGNGNGPNEYVNESLPTVVSNSTIGDIPVPDWLFPGCEIPNIDLDSSKHKVTEEYAGDLNACGPAAAANSIQWLENKHEEIESGTSHREKLEEISSLMERGAEDGVTTTQLIKGKLSFIDKYQLPIHVKYQSFFLTTDSIPSPDTTYGHQADNMSDSIGKQTPPTWEFLKQEVEKGEDVEIMFGWYDHGATRHGGHWVTVSGFVQSGDVKGIFIKDDAEQGDSAGIQNHYHQWETDENWSRLAGYDGPNNYCWVESIVSESYDSTVTFDTAGSEPVSFVENDINDINLVVLNNPGPAGQDAQIGFTLNGSARVSAKVFDNRGALIGQMNFGQMLAIRHIQNLPANWFANKGVYYLALQVDDTLHMVKLIRY
ncbi:MAG: hypothetical protein JW894_06730 [Bacteroidales bacterium]|nr:hypothetical protein [Bacteroidales bacterium]